MTHTGDMTDQQQVRTYSQQSQVTLGWRLSKLSDLYSLCKHNQTKISHSYSPERGLAHFIWAYLSDAGHYKTDCSFF